RANDLANKTIGNFSNLNSTTVVGFPELNGTENEVNIEVNSSATVFNSSDVILNGTGNVENLTTRNLTALNGSINITRNNVAYKTITVFYGKNVKPTVSYEAERVGSSKIRVEGVA
ncbi:MAG: hypothetical protein SXQ77_00020, partial [Halobacteria archaeon]|nr:hypothetical protein [Halobacteria archaeon]